MSRRLLRPAVSLLLPVLLLRSGFASEDLIPAKHKQGSGHAYLSVLGSDGHILAIGDVVEVTHGTKVVSRLTFHFRDGSLDDDTTVFQQAGCLRVISDHHIQQGPSFPHPIDLTIDVTEGEVTVRDPKTGESRPEHMDLPGDLANGILPQILENMAPESPETRVSYLAASSKPLLVHLVLTFICEPCPGIY